MLANFRRRIALIVAGVMLALFIGTIGFTVLEGWSVWDAFYMSVITMTTVGYKEVHDLSTAGQAFNVFLLLFSVTVLFLAIGAMTQMIIELELSGYFPKRRIKRMISQLENHYIVCGFGRVGRAAAAELQRSNVPFLIIDRSEAKVERALREGMIAIAGDSTFDSSLRSARVEKARGLVAALATDADNLFLVLSAKTLNPMLNVATRVIEDEAEQKFRRAGADAVFMPYNMAGSRLAQSILRPHVVEFLEVATAESELKVSIEQVRVPPEFPAKSLADMQLRQQVGVIVLAIRKSTGNMLFNPDPRDRIEPGDYLIAMGSDEQLRRLNSVLETLHA